MTAFLPCEIIAAFAEHTRRPRQDQLDALARKGISVWAAAGAPGSGEHGVGFARVRFDGAAGFDFDPEGGEPSMCVVALDAFCEPADIVAWGSRVGSWLGRAAVLGEQHVAGPRVLDDALAVYPTAFDWLRADRLGVVLIDKVRAAYVLRDAGPFLATGGFEHAAQLVAMLTSPPPRVLIPDPEEERRAA